MIQIEPVVLMAQLQTAFMRGYLYGVLTVTISTALVGVAVMLARHFHFKSVKGDQNGR